MFSAYLKLGKRLSGVVCSGSELTGKAINTDDGERAAKIIKQALGIESDDVLNYCFPKEWPADREQRASVIGDGGRRRRAF